MIFRGSITKLQTASDYPGLLQHLVRRGIEVLHRMFCIITIKNYTLEENTYRKKDRELLRMANIGSMGDIQNCSR